VLAPSQPWNTDNCREITFSLITISAASTTRLCSLLRPRERSERAQRRHSDTAPERPVTREPGPAPGVFRFSYQWVLVAVCNWI
jgi:hypothetical protein